MTVPMKLYRGSREVGACVVRVLTPGRSRLLELTLQSVLKAAVEVAKPCALMREDDRIYRICGDCAAFLQETGMIVASESGVLDIMLGYSPEQIKDAARAHHGKVTQSESQ